MELRFTVKRIFYVTPMAVNISFAKVMTRLQKKFLRRRVFFIGTICLFQESAMKMPQTHWVGIFLRARSRSTASVREGALLIFTEAVLPSGPVWPAGPAGLIPPVNHAVIMVNPRLALHQPRKRPVFFFCKIYLHHLLTVKQATKNAPKGVYWHKYIELLLCGYCLI